jgi:hypothetical protein
MKRKKIFIFVVTLMIFMMLVVSACIIESGSGSGVTNVSQFPSRTPNPTQAWYATATSGTWEFYQQLTAIADEKQNQP